MNKNSTDCNEIMQQLLNIVEIELSVKMCISLCKFKKMFKNKVINNYITLYE